MADGVTLAQAFVEIIPTVKGIQGKLGEAFAPAEKEADAAGKRAGGKFSGGLKVAALGAAGVAAGTVGAVAVIGKQLYDVGSIFDNVSDTLRVGTGASGDALAGLEDVAKRVGRNVPAQFEAIAPAVSDLNTTLGLTGPQLEKVASQVLYAGEMLGEDVNVQAAAAAFSGFNVTAGETDEAMDTLFQVSQATGVGINDLTGVLSKQGGVLTSLGFSFEDSAAMYGVLSKAGVNADGVINSMSRGLVNLAKDGESPAAAFQRVTGELQGFIDSGDEAAALNLASEVFGTRGAPQMIAALKSGKVNLDDMAAAAGLTGDTILGLGAETADLPEQWQMFKNIALESISPIASAVFGLAGEGMGKLTDGLRTVSDSFGGIKTMITTGDFDPSQWAEGVSEDSPIVGFVAALRTGFEAVEPVIGAVRDAFGRIDFGGIGTGLSPIVEGVAALAPALMDAWSNLSPLSLIFQALAPSLPMLGQAFLDIATTLGGALTDVVAALLPAVTQLVGALGPILATVLGSVIPIVVQVVDAFLPMVSMLADMLAPLLTMVAELVTGLLDALMPLIGTLLDVVSSVLGPLLSAVTAILGPLIQLVQAILTPLLGVIGALVPVVAFLGNVLGVVAQIVGAVLNVAIGVLSVAITWLVEQLVVAAGWLSTTFAGVWAGIQAAIAVVVTWVQTVLVPVLVGAWSAIATAAQWLYTNVILPVWSGIQTAIGIVVTAVKIYIGAWVLLFQNVLAPLFRWLWTSVVQPVWSGIQTAISAVVSWFQKTAWPIVKSVIGWVTGAFGTMRDALQMVWFKVRAEIINPVIMWFLGTVWPVINTVLDRIKTGFTVMRDALSGVWTYVKDTVINPVMTWFRDTVEPAFSTAVGKVTSAFETAKDGIKTAWDKIKDIAKKPVDFVVNTVVYNLAQAFDTVAGKFGADKLNFKKVSFASGGVMPGYTPGRDVHQFYSPTGGLLELSGGEPILRPEVGRVLGHGWVHGINAAARSGGTHGVESFLGGGRQSFAGGGIFRKLRDLGGDAIDWAVDGVDFVADALSDPKGALRKVVDALIGAMPGAGAFGDVVKGIPGTIADKIGEHLLGGLDAANADLGPVPAGGSRTLGYAQSLASSMGLTMTSFRRPGARTAGSGVQSLHALGRAKDFSNSSGPTPQMMRFFNALHPLKPTELLYSPAGGRQWRRSGRMADTTGATKRGHYNHVHVGFDQGGIFDQMPFLHDGGGWHDPGTLSLNMLRTPEAVLTDTQWDAIYGAATRTPEAGQTIVQVTPPDSQDPSLFGQRIAEVLDLHRLDEIVEVG